MGRCVELDVRRDMASPDLVGVVRHPTIGFRDVGPVFGVGRVPPGSAIPYMNPFAPANQSF
jgi:hypothetical protein